MVDHDDEALSRLRTSDPATGSHPDLHHLRSLIAQKAPASQGSERATALDDELLRGPRLRAPWIAAAAVAALGLSGGGYALGLQQGDGGTPASRSVSPASAGELHALPGSAAADMAEGAKMAAQAQASGAQADSGSQYASDSAGPAYDLGPVRLTAGEGLPASPGTAEVRVMRNEQEPQEFIDSFASTSGFSGEPLPDSEYFSGPGGEVAGLIDATNGRVVTAYADGGALNFNYEDIYGSEQCAYMYEGIPDEELQAIKEDWAKGYGPTLPFPSPDLCRDVTGERPSDAEAVAAAKEFFAQAGVDVSSFTFTTYAQDDAYASSMEVSADGMMTTEDPGGSDGSSPFVMVDGRSDDAGGLSASVTVGPEGVVSAFASLGELSSLGEYPVISATEAVERYGTREYGMDLSVTIPEDMTAYSDSASMTEMAMEMPQGASLDPGDPLPVLLKDKTVTGAELVRGTLWTQSAGSAEVPVWKLTTEDGMYYTVLALSEEALDFQSWE